MKIVEYKVIQVELAFKRLPGNQVIIWMHFATQRQIMCVQMYMYNTALKEFITVTGILVIKNANIKIISGVQ